VAENITTGAYKVKYVEKWERMLRKNDGEVEIYLDE
jgi:hypothetical protein